MLYNPGKRLPSNPSFVLRTSDQIPVHARQWYERPARDVENGIWIYTDRLSYARGDTVEVKISSTAARCVLEVVSSRNPGTAILRKTVHTRWQDTPDQCSAEGCGWETVHTFTIGKDWPSDVYLIRASSQDHPASVEYRHLFVVRPDAGTRTDSILLLTSDCTWQAYNDWGGSNHYEGIVDADSNRFSAQLSNQRPFARGMVDLPQNAPRTLPETPSDSGPVSYPHMEWAFAGGYSKKYASAGWASYESIFSQWALQNGYGLDVATQQDLHYRPELFEQYPCVVIVGHDEYWSWRMRDHIDAYVEHGGRVARFAGNFFWQIRFEEAGQQQICHKYRARLDDPLYNSVDTHLTTNCWEAPEVGRPGASTFGLNASNGLYAGWGGFTRRSERVFRVNQPDHWSMRETGLKTGDALNTKVPVFGYEVDGLAFTESDGIAYPLENPHVPEDLSIIAHGPAWLREQPGSPDTGELFVGDDDAAFVAETLLGDTSEEALCQVDKGSGMIVHFTRGRGEVFHAGTTAWVAGLLHGDPLVERMTHNVLTAFLKDS